MWAARSMREVYEKSEDPKPKWGLNSNVCIIFVFYLFYFIIWGLWGVSMFTMRAKCITNNNQSKRRNKLPICFWGLCFPPNSKCVVCHFDVDHYGGSQLFWFSEKMDGADVRSRASTAAVLSLIISAVWSRLRVGYQYQYHLPTSYVLGFCNSYYI